MIRFGEVETEVGNVEITRRIDGPEIDVVGNPPPKLGATFWPWLIGAAVLGGLWWITREDAVRRPLGRGRG